MPWIPVTEVEEFLRENNLLRKPGPCPDCGVQPEQMHTVGCDIEKCSVCGHQRISCACPRNGWHDRGFARWTGFPQASLRPLRWELSFDTCPIRRTPSRSTCLA